MNRIKALFQTRDRKRLSIYLTAGYPTLSDTLPICAELQKSGVDLIEIGFPFSDPLADGPVIQHTSEVALKNGMTLSILFDQLKELRKAISIPVLLMGYLNPVLQYGFEAFCKSCAAVGVDGVILPDLPLGEYVSKYKGVLREYSLSQIFLVTPNTSDDRIRAIDQETEGFIYVVSTPSITGGKVEIGERETSYFNRLASMKLKNPLVAGFGIHDKTSFEKATSVLDGGIVGSAFLRAIGEPGERGDKVHRFVNAIRGGDRS